MAIDSQVFQFVSESVNNAAEHYLLPAAHSLMDSLQALVLAGMTLYILLTCYATAMGAVANPLGVYFKQITKAIVIITISLSAENYAYYVVDMFDALQSGLSGALSGDPDKSTPEVIDASINKGLSLVNTCVQKADEAGWHLGTAAAWLIAALVIVVATVTISVLGGSILITASLALKILLAIGPFFITLLIFPVTARFFDGWFSQSMNVVMTTVLFTIGMDMTLAMFDAYIQSVNFDAEDGANPFLVAAVIFILACVMYQLLKQLKNMAAGLAGGLSLEAYNLRESFNTAKAAKNTVNPTSAKRDMETGMINHDTRLGHMWAGNTRLNPAYNQRMKQLQNNGWGLGKGGSVNQG